MPSGLASGLIKLVVGHPFETVKVRMQTEGYAGRFKGPLDCLRTTIRTEGIRGLYKGGTPPLVGWGITDSVMWGARGMVVSQLQTDSSAPLTLWQHYVAGLAAGFASSFVATPVEQVKARLQVQYDASTKTYSGPIDCIKKLVKNNGVLGLYKGFGGTLAFRSFLGVYFGSYEMFKRELTPIMNPQLAQFLSGGLGATSLWLVAYPTDVLKNRMMAQADVKPRKYETLRQCARDVVRQEGWRALYRGFVPCLLRGFPTNGAAFLAAEVVNSWVNPKIQ